MKKLMTLALLAVAGVVLAACGGGSSVDKVLVVGYDPFSEKFSPFFADTAYDQDVVGMTSVGLLTTDRDGGIVYGAIEGETVTRGGVDHFYTGLTDLEVVYNETTDVTTYTITLKQGVKFSDGETLDADDVIFTYYTLLDPYFSGSSTLNSVDIVGYRDYVANDSSATAAAESAQSLLDGVLADLPGNPDEEAAVAEFVAGVLADEVGWVESIMDNAAYIGAGYVRKEDGSAWTEADGAAAKSVPGTFAFFYALEAEYSAVGKTIATVLAEVQAQYGADYETLGANYGGSATYFLEDVKGVIVDSLVAAYLAENPGQPVANISGITKKSQYEVEVKVNGFDAAAVYQVAGITVAPMHYYGVPAKYDYAANKFGFDSRTETAMEPMQAKTSAPMGAGPYKFVKYENNVVYFEANENYYKGEPKTKYVNFQVVAEANKVSAIATGEIDASNPSGSKVRFEEIASYGEQMETYSIDNLGYGYVGINALNIQVGTEEATIGSDESKALRTAFATVVASQRYTVIKSYYGEAANVIEYPISNTSWAAPKPGDTGYQFAFAKKPDGSAVYSAADPSTLTNDVRSAEAKAAAKLWLEEAGYTFASKAGTASFGGQLWTATAPEGAKTTYEFIIPAGGQGNHPSFGIVTVFAQIMAELGITIEVNDPANSNVLWDTLDALEQEMWAAAWGSTIDPDMYQVYHSGNVIGEPNTSGSNHYYIRSAQLDNLIVAARTSADQDFRKTTYKQALDIVLDWAVEVPTYQRQNIILLSAERVDISSVTPDITTYWGWMAEIETLEMN